MKKAIANTMMNMEMCMCGCMCACFDMPLHDELSEERNQD